MILGKREIIYPAASLKILAQKEEDPLALMIHKDYLSTHIVTFFFIFKKMRFDSVSGIFSQTRQDNGKLLKYLDLIWSRPVFVMSDTFLVCRPDDLHESSRSLCDCNAI
jgi:hypothetical protein